MSSIRSFGRQSRLHVGVEGAPGYTTSGLKLVFRIDHTLEKAATKGRISIYNANDATLGALLVPRAVVRLSVGYGYAPSPIFQGEPVTGGVGRQRSGPDSIIKVTATDGGRKLTTNINISYLTTVSAEFVLSAALAQALIPRGYIALPPGLMFPGGIYIQGTITEVLDELANSVNPGLHWYIKDGALNMHPRGTAVPGVAVLLRSDTGLIGSPSATKDLGVRCKALIDPLMRPGRLFQVVSRNLPTNGTYVARTVTFSGDTRGNPWYMEITGAQLGYLR